MEKYLAEGTDLRVLATQRKLSALVHGVRAVAGGRGARDGLAFRLNQLVQAEGRPMMDLFSRIDQAVVDRPKRVARVLGPHFSFPPPPVPLPQEDPTPVEPGHEPSETPHAPPTEGPGLSPPEGFVPHNMCPSVTIRATELEVTKATFPQSLADNIAINMVGAQTAGVPNGAEIPPQQQRYPNPNAVGDSVKVAHGAKDHPNADLRFQAVPLGDSCYIQLVTSITLWEVDAGSVDQAMKKSARKLKDFTLGLATILPGGGLLTAADEAGLFEALFNELMNIIGLGDEYMGTMSFYASGELTSTTPMKNLFWFPDPGVTDGPLEYDFRTDRTAVLTQEFPRHGGLWKLTVHVTRTP